MGCLTVITRGTPSSLVVSGESRNTGLDVTTAMVCRVNVSKYINACVAEGPLMVSNGYLFVKN